VCGVGGTIRRNLLNSDIYIVSFVYFLYRPGAFFLFFFRCRPSQTTMYGEVPFGAAGDF
jgi:hypothetical protein